MRRATRVRAMVGPGIRYAADRAAARRAAEAKAETRRKASDPRAVLSQAHGLEAEAQDEVDRLKPVGRAGARPGRGPHPAGGRGPGGDHRSPDGCRHRAYRGLSRRCRTRGTAPGTKDRQSRSCRRRDRWPPADQPGGAVASVIVAVRARSGRGVRRSRYCFSNCVSFSNDNTPSFSPS
jgi:hypothetical protein